MFNCSYIGVYIIFRYAVHLITKGIFSVIDPMAMKQKFYVKNVVMGNFATLADVDLLVGQ